MHFSLSVCCLEASPSFPYSSRLLHCRCHCEYYATISERTEAKQQTNKAVLLKETFKRNVSNIQRYNKCICFRIIYIKTNPYIAIYLYKLANKELHAWLQCCTYYTCTYVSTCIGNSFGFPVWNNNGRRFSFNFVSNSVEGRMGCGCGVVGCGASLVVCRRRVVSIEAHLYPHWWNNWTGDWLVQWRRCITLHRFLFCVLSFCV